MMIRLPPNWYRPDSWQTQKGRAWDSYAGDPSPALRGFLGWRSPVADDEQTTG